MNCRRNGTYAVALLAVASALLASCVDRPASRAPDRSTSSSRIVHAIAWTDAPAHFQTRVDAPTATPPSDARPCTASDVTVRPAGGNGAGGHSGRYFRFRNISHSTCVLKGYPAVTASEPGRPDIRGRDGSFFPDFPAANLRRGDAAYLVLESDSECGARPGGRGPDPIYRHVAVTLPGGGTLRFPLQPRPKYFGLGCGLGVSRFFVRLPEQDPPGPTIASLRVTLDLPATVRAGATLVYVVRLTNPTSVPIRLRPCPSYVEATASPTPIKEAYQLNCTQTRSITAHGSVAFEMRMRIPSDTPLGRLGVFWSSAGHAQGSVTVIS